MVRVVLCQQRGVFFSHWNCLESPAHGIVKSIFHLCFLYTMHPLSSSARGSIPCLLLPPPSILWFHRNQERKRRRRSRGDGWTPGGCGVFWETKWRHCPKRREWLDRTDVAETWSDVMSEIWACIQRLGGFKREWKKRIEAGECMFPFEGLIHKVTQRKWAQIRRERDFFFLRERG